MTVRKPDVPPARVTVDIEKTIDPNELRWLGHWLRRVLQAKATPGQGR